MNEKNVKLNVLSNLFWKFLERGGTNGVQFIVQIIIARILLPDDYGLIAIVMIFIKFADVLIQSGFNMALIQKKNVDDIDYSSVFYLSLLISGLLYMIIYLLAPIIANFYDKPSLVQLLRVLSITLFLGSINSIQVSIISREMKFKKLFFSSLGSIIFSGAIGIVFAYKGWGVWSLVFQQISNKVIIVFILLFTVKWRPILVFSITRIKTLFSFGWKIMASTLIYNFYNDLRTLIIGKVYTPSVLGFYSKGSQIPGLIVTNIDGSIQSVLLPVLSKEQDDISKIRSMVKRSIVSGSFIIFPTMIGLAAIAEPLVSIILTDKWLPSVPFIRIFCIYYSLRPIHTANQQANNAIGRSDVTLKLSIIKRFVELFILVITVFFGIYAIAMGGIVSGFISSFINAYPNKKLLKYGYKEQWMDIVPAFVASLFMGIVVYFVQFIHLHSIIILIMQVLIGITVYFLISKLFKLKGYNIFVSTLKDLKSSKGSLSNRIGK